MGKENVYLILIVSVIWTIFVLLGGCNMNNSSSSANLSTEPLPPYPVISADPAVDPSVREIAITLPPGSSYQLAIDKDAAGDSDPNGDAVIFESTLPETSFITFDRETGLLTNIFFNTSSYRIEFWSRERDTADPLDSRDDPLVLILSS